MRRHQQIIIGGKVENTGLRLHTYRGATKLNICGEVKQTGGQIIIEAEGEESDLENFIEWCKKGSASSSVESFKTIDKPMTGYQDFNIL